MGRRNPTLQSPGRRTMKPRKRNTRITGRTAKLASTRKAPKRIRSGRKLRKPLRQNHVAYCAESTAQKRGTCMVGNVARRDCVGAHTRDGRKASQRTKCGRL